MPTDDEAVAFGDSVMTLIRDAAATLRSVAPTTLKTVYDDLVDASHAQANVPKREKKAGVNILCAIDILNPPDASESRHGNVRGQFDRIRRERVPHQFVMLEPADPRASEAQTNVGSSRA